jgi:hypothetical protein
MEVVMPIDSMLVSAAVILMFLVFAGALAWGEIQTRPARPTAAAHSRKRLGNQSGKSADSSRDGRRGSAVMT